MIGSTADPRTAGFTLVELMVAVTLSSIVLTGAGIIIAGTYKTQRIQEGIQKVQENARLALEMMARDIRGAGYYGCSGGGVGFTNHLNVDTEIPAPVKGFEHSTSGSDRVWYPSDGSDPDVPSTAAGHDELSDSFVVNFAAETGLTLVAQTGSDTSVNLNDTKGLAVGDYLYLSNCSGSDLFQVSAIDVDKDHVSHTTDGKLEPGNSSDILGNVYGPDDSVLRFISARYYIRDDVDNTDSTGRPIPTLFRSATNSDDDGIPLIPWVENLQILYGEDTAGSKSADIFVNADEVSNWNNVRALRLAFLLRSGEELGRLMDRDLDSDPWQVLDFQVPKDNTRVRRRVYSTTIEIRNAY